MKTFNKITKTPLLKGHDVSQKRQELLEYFHDTFDLYEALFQNLSDAAYYQRADPLRHPLIFYLAHTAVFYINKFLLADLINAPINPKYEKMFAVGVDEMSWDDLNEEHYDWPTVKEVMEYRQQVRTIVTEAIQKAPLTLPIRWEDPSWAIPMGIEHERIHLETSTMLIRQLPLTLLNPDPFWSACQIKGIAPKNQLLSVAAQKFILGKKMDSALYGWDNEYGRESVQTSDFLASQYLVSNQEFLDFVQDSGYQEKRWWTEEGWQWRLYQNVIQPRFWIAEENGDYQLRTMLETTSMPWNWPVEVNYFEAKAFCNWLAHKNQQNVRLPTEVEWYALRHLMAEDQTDWQIAPGNINLEHFMSPCPVNKFATQNFYDVIGNVWQWTETHLIRL